jgi:hypothetical protein
MVSLQKGHVMFVIGIDPHKGSHTAAVLDDTEELVGQSRVTADCWQRDRLLRFAALCSRARSARSVRFHG